MVSLSFFQAKKDQRIDVMNVVEGRKWQSLLYTPEIFLYKFLDNIWKKSKVETKHQEHHSKAVKIFL